MSSQRGHARPVADKPQPVLRPPATLLEAFMRSHHIRPIALEHASGVTRTHLGRIRFGRADPGRRVIAAITRGCRELTNNPKLTALDLFELE